MNAIDEALAAIKVAEQVARTNALLDAEKVVRDRITTTNWASDARLLRLVADDIRKIGGTP